MDIPLFQREKTAGFTPMPKPPYELADKSGQQQFARTMGAIGTNLLDKYLQARQANEESQFIGQVKSAQAGFRNWLQENPQATPEEMFAERDKMVKSIDDISVNNKFLPATKNYIKNFIASNKEKMIKDADYDITAIGMQQQMTQLNANIDLLEMEGDYAGVEKLVDDSPLSQPDKDLAKAKSKVKIDTLNQKRALQTFEGDIFAIAATQGYEEADRQLQDPKTMQKLIDLGIEREDLTAAKNDIKARLKDQKDVDNENANKELTDLMLNKKPFLPSDVIARKEKLNKADYESWAKIALNPPDKKENIIEETTLKIAASDIWRGTITKDEFDKKVMKSLADPNGINTKQYAAVMDIADSKLEKSQAEDMRRFSRDAANVILGQFSGLLQFDAMGNLSGINLAGLSGDDVEDAKYRFNYLSNYEQGLRDFIAANPKASGKEFYQFASEQKIRYWNASLEDIKATAQRQGKATNVISPEELRKQNTKEAYEQGVTLGYWK